MGAMIVTTTNHVEGKQITNYLRIVAGETVFGMNVIRDLGASVREIFGGRAGGYEKELVNAREEALREMVDRALELGANCVVGVALDYSPIGQGGGMILVTATGTAVTLSDQS